MRFANIFSDGAVMKGGEPVKLWGWASSLSKVTVRVFNNEAVLCSIAVDSDNDGRFEVILPVFKSGKTTYKIAAESDGERIVLNDIVFGIVIIAAGQSNMQYSAGCLNNRKELKDRLNNPYLRYVNIYSGNEEEMHSRVLLKELKHFGWEHLVGERHLSAISGIALIAALSIFEGQQVPVGILNMAVGGSSVQSWLPPETIAQDKLLLEYYQELHKDVVNDKEAFRRLTIMKI